MRAVGVRPGRLCMAPGGRRSPLHTLSPSSHLAQHQTHLLHAAVLGGPAGFAAVCSEHMRHGRLPAPDDTPGEATQKWEAMK